MIAEATALPVFDRLVQHAQALDDGVAHEARWLHEVAAGGGRAAHLWSGPPGFVVPRSYERAPHWAAACAASAASGWPVQLRATGGGLVPQGPGVLNLSLLWCVPAGAPSATEAVYHGLCARLSAALARLGIAADAQAVQGSFCDGRYNLAAGGAKLAGTAQGWRRVDGVPTVLAHAVLLVDADPADLSARCTALEAAFGHDRHYRSDAVTSVARAWSAAHAGRAPPHDLPAQLASAIADSLATPPAARPA